MNPPPHSISAINLPQFFNVFVKSSKNDGRLTFQRTVANFVGAILSCETHDEIGTGFRENRKRSRALLLIFSCDFICLPVSLRVCVSFAFFSPPSFVSNEKQPTTTTGYRGVTKVTDDARSSSWLVRTQTSGAAFFFPRDFQLANSSCCGRVEKKLWKLIFFF